MTRGELSHLITLAHAHLTLSMRQLARYELNKDQYSEINRVLRRLAEAEKELRQRSMENI